MGEVFSYRNFGERIECIAKNWFRTPVQTIGIEQIGDYSTSNDGACEVKFDTDLIGYMKPRAETGNMIVANEKIAADIGHLLGLPLAPAVILPPEKQRDDRYRLLSLACLKSARHWGRTPPALTPENVPALETLRVFWTWIGDVDHDEHPENLIYEMRSGGAFQFVTFDHGFIWGGWGDEINDPLTSAPSRGYATASHRAAAEPRRAAIAAIRGLDAGAVQRVVGRLVGTVLTQDQAVRIAAWLDERRKNLDTLLNPKDVAHDGT